MLSKFSVLKSLRVNLPFVRRLGGLTPLEKYERLRKLCCTSDIAKRKIEMEEQVRPKTIEIDCPEECAPTKAPDLLDIRRKNAIIIGGGSSVGYEAAYYLLAEGVERVIIADVNQCTGVEVTKKLVDLFGCGKAFYLMTDVVQQPSIEMAFKQIYSLIGRLHVYVNCAAIYNETPQCWEKMITNNLLGTVRGMLLAYKYLSCNAEEDCCTSSVILNVTSYGSIANVPTMPLFSAASGGISGLTSSFGQNFHYCKTRVRCLTLCASCSDSGLLKNMERYHYDKGWASKSAAAMRCCTKQSSKVVGKAIVQAVKSGLNGAVYVVKDGKYYRFAMPDYVKLLRQEVILY